MYRGSRLDVLVLLTLAALESAVACGPGTPTDSASPHGSAPPHATASPTASAPTPLPPAAPTPGGAASPGLLGIPAPSFGVAEQAGEPMFFVDPSAPACSDAGPGTGAAPRCSIPNPVPSGAVVQLAGTFTGALQLTLDGTASAPVFVRGARAEARPKITAEWTVRGTYAILENLEFAGTPGLDGALTVLVPSSHVAVRYSEFHNPGQARGGALTLANWGGPGVNRNIVLLGNHIHDNGNVNATFDQDCHGIGITDGNNVWVLDNVMERNSGDGIQINGTTARVHHIFVGRNRASGNKQTGFWTKTAADVIFSQNVSSGHRPSGSSGAGMGYQYDPQRVWFVANEIHDNTLGLASASRDNGSRRDVYVLGNLIRDNRGSGLILNDDVEGDFVVASNTIAGNPTAIDNGYYRARPSMSNNLLARATTYLNFDEGEGARLRNTLFDVASPRVVGVSCLAGCVYGDPRLAGVNDYRLLGSSPAIDQGVAEAAYAKFQQLYGISIALDRDGLPRPLGSGWDIGAYEYPGAASRNRRP